MTSTTAATMPGSDSSASRGEQGSAHPEAFLPLTIETAARNIATAAGGTALSAAQRSAYAQLAALPFITSRDELWRYTKPESFGFARFANPVETRFTVASQNSDRSTSETLPRGVTVSATLAPQEALIKELLGAKSADLVELPEAQLQLAGTSSCLLIDIKANTAVDAPLVLSQAIPAPSADGAAASVVVVNVQRGAQVTIIEDLNFETPSLVAPRVEIVVGENAEAQFVSVQRLGDATKYIARHRIHTARDSRVKTVHVALGALASRVDLDLKMYEPGASVDMLALYIADKSRLTDFHPTQYHLAPNCHSDFFSKGVIKDTAHSVYYGFIRVAEGAQKTDAYQTNRNLALSAGARADSIPNLEIEANDVRCSHGASVGHVDQEDMFYLMSRGLSRAMAERILVQGFLEDLLARVSNPALHEWLNSVVMERLNADSGR